MTKKLIIDITNRNLTMLDNYAQQGNRLYTKINRECIETAMINKGKYPNYLVCDRRTCGYISDLDSFTIEKFKYMDLFSINELTHIGSLGNRYSVYMDPYLEMDTILIKYNKADERDHKLESLLGDCNDDTFIDTVEVKVVGLA